MCLNLRYPQASNKPLKMPPHEVNPHEGALLSNLPDTVWQIELAALLRTVDDFRPEKCSFYGSDKRMDSHGGKVSRAPERYYKPAFLRLMNESRFYSFSGLTHKTE